MAGMVAVETAVVALGWVGSEVAIVAVMLASEAVAMARVE